MIRLLLFEAMHDHERLLRCSEADRMRVARIAPVLIEALATRDAEPIG